MYRDTEQTQKHKALTLKEELFAAYRESYEKAIADQYRSVVSDCRGAAAKGETSLFLVGALRRGVADRLIGDGLEIETHLDYGGTTFGTTISWAD